MESQHRLLAGTKNREIYDRALHSVSEQSSGHAIVAGIWQAYKLQNPKAERVTNGAILELAVCETLARSNVGPLYYQVEFAWLPEHTFDIAAWTQQNSPVIISVKNSLRERWKQADLEGLALKAKFPRAYSYLVTQEANEAARRKQSIAAGGCAGLDEVILANKPEMDEFIEKLKGLNLIPATKIMPLNGQLFSD